MKQENKKVKPAHLYRLRVKFNNPSIKWDISIVAMDTHSVNMWITSQQDNFYTFYITDVHIELIMLDYEQVETNHLAHALPEGSIQY